MKVIAVAAAALLAACAYQVKSPWNPAEYAAFKGVGTASVTGLRIPTKPATHSDLKPAIVPT